MTINRSVTRGVGKAEQVGPAPSLETNDRLDIWAETTDGDLFTENSAAGRGVLRVTVGGNPAGRALLVALDVSWFYSDWPTYWTYELFVGNNRHWGSGGIPTGSPPESLEAAPWRSGDVGPIVYSVIVPHNWVGDIDIVVRVYFEPVQAGPLLTNLGGSYGPMSLVVIGAQTTEGGST